MYMLEINLQTTLVAGTVEVLVKMVMDVVVEVVLIFVQYLHHLLTLLNGIMLHL